LGKNDLLLAIPNKGRLHEPTLQLLTKAGVNVKGTERKYICETSLPFMKILSARAADIPTYVGYGAADLGVTGLDMAYEYKADLYELLDLKYAPCRLALAVPNSSKIGSLEDIGKGLRVATEFVNLTRGFFEQRGIQVDIIPIHGAAEITPTIGLADAIVDLVDTGSTLRANDLREIATILKSSTRLLCNKISFRTKVVMIQSFVEQVRKAQNL
jgi:ATP phosphoribosyltransferase